MKMPEKHDPLAAIRGKEQGIGQPAFAMAHLRGRYTAVRLQKQ